MILIADSGSSKTDWRILQPDGKITQAKTIGFNPFYQSQEQLDIELRHKLMPEISEEVTKVFYYGAGCSTEANINLIKSVLQSLFSKADIEVHHDLLAAARALCGHEPGIACIIGTGINSAYYDGKRIAENTPSLGYVLGDEGGGTHLGKQLLGDYIRKDLPKNLEDRFFKRFGLTRDDILDSVYKNERPGRFMAGFSTFIFQNINEPYCHTLVYESFKAFFEKNVIKYEAHKTQQVHFTGSVAFYYGNILRQAAADLSISVGKVIESPIAGLTLYHQKELN
ncbi:N-acetylglucosamine kinase [Fulvivirga sp. RKSG066]|uniref:N-acetylglucosamine kinase n=1 Tax=Fulvivirga aurantia TaxID=2529383 RepID=UPI0012BBD4AC|nr:N-acetylglucosamine kinase [Fulvivirga aurantia]MTI20973.1 N-acetylglucosamine kinase [Fulvivirga aurantia]